MLNNVFKIKKRLVHVLMLCYNVYLLEEIPVYSRTQR